MTIAAITRAPSLPVLRDLDAARSCNPRWFVVGQWRGNNRRYEAFCLAAHDPSHAPSSEAALSELMSNMGNHIPEHPALVFAGGVYEAKAIYSLHRAR
jgi:hypothetical protein